MRQRRSKTPRGFWCPRLHPLLALLLSVAFLFSGCSTLKELKEAKADAAAGKYQELAAREVACKPTAAGCNQLHLIKGDACFRLAKEGVNPENHYACAVEHLEKGIELTKTWQSGELDLNRAQTYENLLESLRNLQDLQRGTAAQATGARFLEVAEEFERLEPNNLGAIYFAAKARMRALQPELLHITSANRGLLCSRLKKIRAPVARVLARPPAENWSRYEQNYRQLDRELTLAQSLVPDCP